MAIEVIKVIIELYEGNEIIETLIEPYIVPNY